MTKSHYSLLIVDDDKALCELLAEYLSNEQFRVTCIHKGREALEILSEQNTAQTQFDAIVLDIMMPDITGLDVLSSVRAFSNIPIVMLTGRGDDIDRIVGLEMGADDYLGKPCNPRELSARLRAVLRRTTNISPSQERSPATSSVVSAHNITANPSTLTATVNTIEVKLTSAEFQVLYLLMSSLGSILTKEALTENVLRRKLSAYDRSIDVHVSRVRQKIIQAHGPKDIIKTVRGKGYQMISDSSQ